MSTMTTAVEYSDLSLPIIDISPLMQHSVDNAARNPSSLTVRDVVELTGGIEGGTEFEAKVSQVAEQIGRACKEFGFFYIVNYGAQFDELSDELFKVGREFFAKPLDYKNQFHMRNSKVYRGFFQLGDELTSYQKDWKEGYYFSSELTEDHPAVIAKTPMHGCNQWPDESQSPEFKRVVLKYMDSLTQLGHILMTGVAISLGLDKDFFRNEFTNEPFIPFRLFHYPADPTGLHDDGRVRWGVGRHTDYGVLTLLRQDDCGGLEVEHRGTGQWIQAPFIPNSFVVNIGDMLERWTCGHYKATPHRVKNTSGKDRLSAPFFFDPNFNCIVKPLKQFAESEEDENKWPPVKYGDYILAKVFAVFPELLNDALK